MSCAKKQKREFVAYTPPDAFKGSISSALPKYSGIQKYLSAQFSS